jgi:hypothetical protein
MPRPLADQPPAMFGSDGMLIPGALRRRLDWYSARYREMTPEQRAETDAAARAAAQRMDPSGRLLHLLEIGPDGFEAERVARGDAVARYEREAHDHRL